MGFNLLEVVEVLGQLKVIRILNMVILIQLYMLVIADGVTKRKFTQASQKIFFKPSGTSAKRTDILA